MKTKDSPEEDVNAQEHRPRSRAPAYRIPPDEKVLEAILESVSAGRMNSQNQLASEVLKRISDLGVRFALSPKRARKIASKEKAIRIRVVTRRAARAMRRCPFCSSSMRQMEATDIFGRATTGGKKCPECGFTVDPGRRGPARYIFELRW